MRKTFSSHKLVHAYKKHTQIITLLVSIGGTKISGLAFTFITPFRNEIIYIF